MSNKHLQLNPHKIRGTKTAWWYEEDDGITIVQQYHAPDGTSIGTSSVLIPWQSLRGALARKDQP